VSNMIKKLLIIAVLALTSVIAVYANSVINNEETPYEETYYNYIEDELLKSSRYTRMDDLSLVDEAHYIEITENDTLVHSNAQFNLYLNEETLNFKIEHTETSYVFSTAIDNASAGSFTGLLSSGIGIEYINKQQSMNTRANVGLVDTEFTLETMPIENGIRLNLSVGGFCTTRNCSRFYDSYLDGQYTLEQMIEFGFTEINVSFSLDVTLTDQGIKAHIPYDSIVEEGTDWTTLSSIILFPGLGATRMDDIPGYMVIPDGVGTLIRYEDNEGMYGTPFEERFYGSNLGLTSGRLSVSSYPLSMPIFGAVHGVNQNGFVGIIEQGDMNARLLAYPNGASNLDYNLIFTKFDYKQTYRQSFTTDGSGGAQRIAKTNQTDVTVHYNFLSGDAATYVGVGRNYQDYLKTTNQLNEKTFDYDKIPIHIQVLMSDSTNRFLGKSLVEMTNVEGVLTLYDALREEGLTHQKVSLLGWNDGGYSGQLPSDVDFENKLGSNNDFEAMIEYILNDNELLLVNNYVDATEGTNRVSYRNDVAQGVDRFKIERECSRCVYNNQYTLYPFVTERLALRDYSDVSDLGVSVLFETLGHELFSYYDSTMYTREDGFNHYQKVMEQYSGQASYQYPNAYSYPYTDAFYHTPLYNSQLKYFDDVVPLLPVVLNGYMELYSNHLNFNSLGQEQILKLIDYGINPSFILSEARASNLRNTDIEYLYSTNFDVWEDSVVETYNYINGALNQVIGETIESRVVLETGLVKVTYSNDVYIIINYTSQAVDYDGVSVEGMNYYLGGERS